MQSHFQGMRYGDLKKTVAEAVISHLEPIQARYREITADPEYLPRVLREGAERVSPAAKDTVLKVKRAMGLYATP
jgi:tryptophanyl-tRNA synthetase